jgi:hypothetical protein
LERELQSLAYDPDPEELARPYVKKLLRIEDYIPIENPIVKVGVHGRNLLPAIKLRKNNYCSICSDTATKQAIYNVGGAELVEKYCDKCIQRIN